MLSWLDEAGAITAMEYANSHRMVTLKMSEVLFKKPVKVHDIVCIYAAIGRVGNTSVTIHLQAKTKDLETGVEVTVAETEMVFVKVDENGQPTRLFKND
jgi:acyl-CoA thioesterase YciA